MVGADACRDVLLRRFAAKSGCVAIDGFAILFRGIYFSHDFRVVVQDTGKIHHFAQVPDLRHGEEGFHIIRVKPGAGRFKGGGRNTARGAETEFEWNGAAIADHVTDAFHPADVGDFMRVADGAHRAMDHGHPGKFGRHQHGAFHVHVAVDKARQYKPRDGLISLQSGADAGDFTLFDVQGNLFGSSFRNDHHGSADAEVRHDLFFDRLKIGINGKTVLEILRYICAIAGQFKPAYHKKKLTQMKSVKLFFLGLAGLFFTQAGAQTADEVINSHVAALGGKEKLESLKSVKMTGNMSTQGVDIAMTMVRAHNTGMRLDMDIMGSSNYQMLNQNEGWVFMPVMGMTEPKKMDDDQFKSSLSQLDIQGQLFNYKEKGSTVELLGKDKVDGNEAFKIKLVNKSGKEVIYYIDAKTYFLVKTSSKVSREGQEMENETSFSDYKQTAEGYWFPHTMTTMQGPITYDKIEANVKVEDSMFKN